MAIRKEKLVQGEYYHIYNRGVDKRAIFSNKFDLQRFFQSMEEFNVEQPIGSIYLNTFNKEKLRDPASKLVNFVAFCLNPNHYHFLITPLVENGVEKFMQRLGTGYTLYFNKKEKRSGSLFQGKFKSKHINLNKYLLHASSYINLNNYDKNGKDKNKLSMSSWEEYIGISNTNFCDKSIILGQFESINEYKKFTLESWKETCKRKEEIKDFEFEVKLRGRTSQ